MGTRSDCSVSPPDPFFRDVVREEVTTPADGTTILFLVECLGFLEILFDDAYIATCEIPEAPPVD